VSEKSAQSKRNVERWVWFPGRQETRRGKGGDGDHPKRLVGRLLRANTHSVWHRGKWNGLYFQSPLL